MLTEDLKLLIARDPRVVYAGSIEHQALVACIVHHEGKIAETKNLRARLKEIFKSTPVSSRGLTPDAFVIDRRRRELRIYEVEVSERTDLTKYSGIEIFLENRGWRLVLIRHTLRIRRYEFHPDDTYNSFVTIKRLEERAQKKLDKARRTDYPRGVVSLLHQDWQELRNLLTLARRRHRKNPKSSPGRR